MNKNRVQALCSREAREMIRKIASNRGQLMEYCLNEIVGKEYKRVFKEDISKGENNE